MRVPRSGRCGVPRRGSWSPNPTGYPRRAGWSRSRRVGRQVTVPDGVLLDLGATGKAYAAEVCARLVARQCDTGVLVSLGGDLATAGPAPVGGWQVLVQDGPDEPGCTIALP